jgi:hypothetical protein
MKKIIGILLFLSITRIAISQVALSYYPNTGFIGVGTNPTNILWADLRLQVNTFAGYSNMELSPKVNLKRNELIRIYTGAGVNFNVAYGLFDGQYINGYLISSGVMVSPFKAARNLSFIFELSPYVNYNLNSGALRATLGVSWLFKRKKEPETH